MTDLADQTGGRVCLNDNDLGDCVKKAVDDASSYYELGYYPDAGDWRGEYHRITVKTTQPGVHLSYRQGYYAKPRSTAETAVAPGAQDSDPRLHQAACEDPLTSTAVLLMAKPTPPDEAGAAKYFLAIDCAHAFLHTARRRNSRTRHQRRRLHFRQDRTTLAVLAEELSSQAQRRAIHRRVARNHANVPVLPQTRSGPRAPAGSRLSQRPHRLRRHPLYGYAHPGPDADVRTPTARQAPTRFYLYTMNRVPHISRPLRDVGLFVGHRYDGQLSRASLYQ